MCCGCPKNGGDRFIFGCLVGRFWGNGERGTGDEERIVLMGVGAKNFCASGRLTPTPLHQPFLLPTSYFLLAEPV